MKIETNKLTGERRHLVSFIFLSQPALDRSTPASAISEAYPQCKSRGPTPTVSHQWW